MSTDNGAKGSRSLRPTSYISSSVLSPKKHFTMPGTPTPGAKLTCLQGSKFKGGRTWPAVPIFPVPSLFHTKQATAYEGDSLAPAREGCPHSLPVALYQALPETWGVSSKLGPQHRDWHSVSSPGLWPRARSLGDEAMYRAASRRAKTGWGVSFPWFPGHRQTYLAGE